MTTAYLPPLSWWHQWLGEGMPDLDLSRPYCKRQGINRCEIDSPNGKLQLTVPIAKSGLAGEGNRMTMKDVRISEHGDWRHKHWHALQSTYYNSPFFEYYQDDFLPIYEHQYDSLAEFNQALIDVCVSLLGIGKSVTGIGGTDPSAPLTDEEGGAGLPQTPPTRYSETYYQVFAHKHGFLPDLSIFDLLMNMGPESLLYL